MCQKKRYRYNKETLSYDTYKTPFSKSFLRSSGLFILSIGAFFTYLYIYTEVLGLDTPKSQILKRQNSEWTSKLKILNKKFDSFDSKLTEFQLRDNVVYRSIFGMEEIPQDIRNAGFGGVDRYSHLEVVDYSGILTRTVQRLDILQKKAYIQSKSLDEVSLLSKRSDEIAQCVPSISPVMTDWKKIRISSSYGRRLDPITRRGYTMHSGLDIAGPSGYPIHTTGDGVVEKVAYDYYGYGHFVLVDHGFGYKTRYAHMRKTSVVKGQKISRGEEVGEMGNTGKRSTGTHLHYEVIFKGKATNPINYFDSKMSPENYAGMIKPKRNPSV